MNRLHCSQLSRGIALLGLFLILATPALAGDPSPQPSVTEIGPGFDYWQTVGSGATVYNFKKNPLPADFFCKGSKPFTEVVALEGAPLETEPHRALGTTDTIVERLDTIKFDKTGFASTRIRVRALDLQSRDVIETACGDWRLRAVLKGEQPITQMSLQQSRSCASTGVFTATLELNVNLRFVHTATDKSLSVDRAIDLPLFTDEQFTAGQAAANCQTSSLPAHQLVRVTVGDFDVRGSSSSDALAMGCACNCDGTRCLPLLPAHESFDDETHFTVPPCEFFGTACFGKSAYVNAVDSQLKALAADGILDEPVNEALEKIVSKNY